MTLWNACEKCLVFVQISAKNLDWFWYKAVNRDFMTITVIKCQQTVVGLE